MENFYGSNADSWAYNIDNIDSLPSSWGLSKNNADIKDWNSTSTGYHLRYHSKALVLSDVDIYWGDVYLLKTDILMKQFPTIYIYRNSTHLISNNTTSLKVKGVNSYGNAISRYASFKPYTLSNYEICLLINGYFYRVEIEQKQEDDYAVELSRTNPTRTSFQPYEKVDLTGIGISVEKYKCTYSSLSQKKDLIETVNCSSWEEICSKADYVASPPSIGYYTESNIGQNEICVRFNNSDFFWNLTIEDFKNEEFVCEQKLNSDFGIYVGKIVGEDFLNAFQITRVRSNEFKTIRTIMYDSLDLAKMSNTILSWDDIAFSFVYNLSLRIRIRVRILDNLHFLSKTNAFANIFKTTTYKIGDTLNLNSIDFLRAGYLTYDDNTTIPLNGVARSGSPYATSSLGEGEIEITESTPSKFSVTYVIPTVYFGTLEYTFLCCVDGKSDTFIDSVVLDNPKTNFKYGEVIDFGEDAKLLCYNEDNELLETIPYNDFSNRITENDSRYGLKVTYENGLLIDNPLVLVSKMGTKEFRQEVTFNYAESSLNLDTTNVNKLVYIDSSFEDFNYDGIKASVKYHNNEKGVIEEVPLAFEDLSFSHDQVDLSTDSKVYNIKVMAQYDGQIVSNYFMIQAEIIRPIRIEVIGDNDTLTYFDNDLDKFHYPNGVTFNMYWNNSNDPIRINPEDTLTFYRDEKFEKIIFPQSTIKASEGETIYIKHKFYNNLSSHYNIKFKDDEIVSLISQSPVSIVLGTTFNENREKFKIKATYESGQQTNDDFQDYRFLNQNRLMEPENVVLVYNDKEYALEAQDVTYIVPQIKEIVPDFSKFASSYNNESDSINVSQVSFKVYYEDSSYVQNVNVFNQTKTTTNEFSVYCSALLNYAFDGTKMISVKMADNEVQKRISLEFSVFNIFDKTNTTNSTYSYNVSIIEITDVLGISLVNAYQNYHVGDSFLNENDDTEVLIYYMGSDSKQRKLQIPLKSSFSALNIMPLKNTVFYKTERARTVRVSSATNEKASLEYTISVNAQYDYSTTKSRNLRAIKVDSYIMPNDVEIKDKYILVEDQYTQVVNGVRSLNPIYSVNSSEVEVFGYLDDINDKSKNARVILFKDYIPPIAGESNITVKFPCYVNGSSDYINKCHFGHLFGNNNAKNRLFLSGNEEFPNCDWHSGAVNTTKQEGDFVDSNGDFTYFEDTSYCFYGQTDNKVIGYDIVSNDKMVVFKSKSDKEPTIYYRTNGLIQAIDGAGSNQVGLSSESLYEESYPLVTGNIGAGAISNKSIANFNGDTLLVSSDKQLDGLDVVGIIGDNQRYANTRSYYINPMLQKLDLSKVQLFTNNKYLFLILEDCVLVTHFEKYSSESKQYEWWKLDIKNISTMIEFNDKIYFGTNNGNLFALENGLYQDITKLFIGQNGSMLASEGDFDDVVTVSRETINQLQEDSEYFFKVIPTESDSSTFMYYQIATINNVKNGNIDLYVNEDLNALEVVGLSNSQPDYEKIGVLRNKLNENTTYYLNHLENENDISCQSKSLFGQYYRKYRLEPYLNDETLDHGELFKIIDVETETEMNVSELYRASLCVCLDEEYLIKNINKETCTFELHNEFGKINLIRYANQSISKSFEAEIKQYSNVKAYYITAPFTNGNLMYDMTIWGWTLTGDTNIPSTIEVCQATNDVDFDEMVSLVDFRKTDYGHDLEKLDYSSIDFDKFVIPHKYTFYRPLKVPFICFGFRNNEGTNCVLNLMQVIYTIPNGSIGKN